ncbi:MAG TPA: oligosaccharide flippase family protein [Vicinamibacterales bacterium]|nr:oligosaccharide flippase family protein [Vicinamibacterales bacterium]
MCHTSCFVTGMPDGTNSTAATNLIAGTVTKYVVLGLNISLGAVLMPFTVRHLGQTEYGLWMLVASMTTYFQLLDLGYGNGVVRHLIEADRRGDRGEVNRIASTFVCVYAGIAVVAGAVIVAMVLVAVPRFPHLSPSQLRLAQALLAILGARVAIGFPLTVFGAVTNARQGFARNNLVASASVLLNALSTYAVLEAGGGLLTLVSTTTAVNIAAYAGYAWNAYRVMPELRIRPAYFSASQWREVTSFSLYLFVINVAAQISFNIDSVVVGAVLGPAAVAVYTVALRLGQYQRRLCDQFSVMLFPIAMAFGADGDRAGLRRTLVEGNRIGMTMVTGASVVLIGFSEPLILKWMGPAFAGSVLPFNVLAIAGVILVSQGASHNVLIATGHHRMVTGIWVGEAIVNLGLSLVLVRAIGLPGVAIGTLVPLVFGHLVVMQAAACRAVALPVPRCVIETVRPAAVAAAVAAACGMAIRWTWPPASAAAVLVESVLVGAIYGGSLATIGFDAVTRAAYVGQFRQACRAALAKWKRLSRRSTKTIDPAGSLSSSVTVP